MKEIKRQNYLNELISARENKLIKVITGIRRCGKSYLLDPIYKNYLKSNGVNEDHIIKLDLDVIENSKYRDPMELYNYVINCVKDTNMYYVLLDEIQLVKNFEEVLNSFLRKPNLDVYVTGSNSKLMSSEISTYLSGRYVSIPVYTLSFREYITFKNKNNVNIKEMFDEYLQYGGFPLIGISDFDTTSAYQVVEGIYSAVITRDISKRHKIRNKDLFDRVVKYVIENLGKTFSANSIVKFLKNEQRTLSIETIYNYLKWLADAFIVYPCNRYDIQGKSVLKTQEKYYLSDISFKYSQFGYNSSMIASILENIVYLEMKRRGYEVYVGKNANKEIDFIGVKREEKVYIQVCRDLTDNSSREIDNLMEIKDHYHKYVVTNDILAKGNDNGIEIMYIAEFLLKEKW